MTGREYLEDIRTKLESGRYQNRMGRSVLRAFGYVRRRATSVEEINTTLKEVGLVADPPIDAEMPLESPRIKFSLKDATPELVNDPEDTSRSDAPSQDDDDDSNLLEPAFTVSELDSADKPVERVPPGASVKEAYTKMRLSNYSQLVVASNDKPRQQDIKGIVSLQSLAKALMNGNPTTVGDCMDKDMSFAENDTDLKSILGQLSENDVVLVIGQDKRLQGIVTAWDLAKEFADLVDPFKRIGEIEERLQTLIGRRLGKHKVTKFLRDIGSSSDDSIVEIEELTMGGLQRVLDSASHWDDLGLAFDKNVFIKALNDVRKYRNRLMHFGDPLNETETTHLVNFCRIVREIQL